MHSRGWQIVNSCKGQRKIHNRNYDKYECANKFDMYMQMLSLCLPPHHPQQWRRRSAASTTSSNLNTGKPPRGVQEAPGPAISTAAPATADTAEAISVRSSSTAARPRPARAGGSAPAALAALGLHTGFSTGDRVARRISACRQRGGGGGGAAAGRGGATGERR